MSYAHGTENFDFPQFVASDRPTFVDFNAAFRIIDTKLFALEGDASTTDGRLDTIEAALPVMDAATQSAQNTADSAKAEADTNAEHITALEVLTGHHTTQIANKLDSVAIAEQYDPNAGTYSVGDIVVYNGQRYRCTTQVAVAEPFDADKWTGEDVETVLTALATRGTIASLGTVTGNSDFELPSQYLNSNYEIVVSVVYNSIVYAEFRVQGNEIYRANMVMGGYANSSFNRYIELYGHDSNQIRINSFFINGTDEKANITVYIGARKLA